MQRRFVKDSAVFASLRDLNLRAENLQPVLKRLQIFPSGPFVDMKVLVDLPQRPLLLQKFSHLQLPHKCVIIERYIVQRRFDLDTFRPPQIIVKSDNQRPGSFLT